MALGRDEFDKWCRDRGENPTDELHDEGFASLIAYEEQLRARNGWGVRANYTWRQIRKLGFIGSTEARVLGGSLVGFKTLMESHLRQLTDEYLVIKYPDEFSEKAVRIAKERLDAWERGEIVLRAPTGNPTWVRDELIVALDVYLRHEGNPPPKVSPEIEELSETLNRLGRYLGITTADRFRNPNGVYVKLMNFRRLDTSFIGEGKTGLTHGGVEEEAVWNEFASDQQRCHTVAETIRQVIANVPENETIASNPAEPEITEAEEGRVVTVLHLRHERNAALVKARKQSALKKLGKLECEACGFDFHARYGGRGEGFIECHHAKPVHTLRPEEKTKLTDLHLICANCHRMLHAKRPWLTMEQLVSTLGARSRHVAGSETTAAASLDPILDPNAAGAGDAGRDESGRRAPQVITNQS